ncbi:MAG: CAP domain-containing protein [Myxococcales bacterium]|nr:CAP domain-containing protein [Myxococcales bacterium]
MVWRAGSSLVACRGGRALLLAGGLALAASACDPDDSGEPVDPLAGVAGCEDAREWTEEGAIFEARVLERIGEERRTGGRCGERTFPPQGPLPMDPELRCAARLHSLDMAADNYVGYVAEDALGVADRLDAVDYDYGLWAATVGAGWTVADHAVDSWLESEHHCWKLFAAEFDGVGVGVVVLPEPEAPPEGEEAVPAHRSYWTLVVGDEVR